MFERVQNQLKQTGWKTYYQDPKEYEDMTSFCGCLDKTYNSQYNSLYEKAPYCKNWIKRKTDPCNVCTADAVCTKRDTVTNITTHTLKTPYKNEQKVTLKIGQTFSCFKLEIKKIFFFFF